MSQTPSSASFFVLNARSQYTSCHVTVPDIDERLPAIRIGDRYYSFFKVAPNSQKALTTLAKLVFGGDEVALTKLKKGYSLWLLEPEARLESSKRKIFNNTAVPAPCRIFAANGDYQLQDIRVPDIDVLLPGVAIADQHFSMFKVVDDTQEIIELVARITQRGDEAVIVKVKSGYAVCILEPQAQATNSTAVTAKFLSMNNEIAIADGQPQRLAYS